MKNERAQFSGSRLNFEGGTPASPIRDKEKSVERQARAQNEDLGYCSMNMLIRPIAALVSLTITLSVSATSWHDNSHYVALGPRTGYYIVRPGSSLSHQLGIDSAPTVDTADPFNHGYGADALAFRFSRASILSAPPAYIVQATPNQFYTQRLGSFIRGQSRLSDVEGFFGQPQSIERRPDGYIAYFSIQVYNSFENL